MLSAMIVGMPRLSRATVAGGQQRQEVEEIRAVELRRLLRQAPREIGVTEDRHAVRRHHLLAGHGALDVAAFAVEALARGHVDDDAAGLHRRDIGGRDEARGRTPGDERRRDDDVDVGGLIAVEPRRGGVVRGARRLRIAVGGHLLRLVGHDDVEVAAADRAHLVGDLGTRVGRAHDRAEARGGADRGEPGDTGARDEHLRGRHLAGGGDLAREEAAELVRRLDDGPIAGDVGHRAQDVHRLRPGDARYGIHRQRRHAAGRERGEQVGAQGRAEQADEGRPRSQARDVGIRRRVDPQDDVRGPGGVAIDDRRSRCEVRVVGERRGAAGPGGDRDLVPERAQSGDGDGRGGDPVLSRLLGDDPDARHRRAPSWCFRPDYRGDPPGAAERDDRVNRPPCGVRRLVP